MMLVSTYGENEWAGEDKIWTIGGERTIFDYPETVNNNHQHRNAVEYHKKMCQPPIALEEKWSTRHWEIVFCLSVGFVGGEC